MTQQELRWYVVQAQPHAEGKAAVNLARQGFEPYLPRFLKRRRHARRIESVLAPLFPGYLFVKFDIDTQRWRSIQSTFGVSRLVCNGDKPAFVPEGVVAGLKMREQEDGIVQLDPAPRFDRGERVRIVDGVFAACLGLYEGMTDRDRVAVLLDLLGRKVRVVVDDLSVVAA
ncbi:MAG: transcription termination/antitermination protein NusG [Pseudolabrys sp.]